MSGFLDAQEAYPDGWHVAGMRVTLTRIARADCEVDPCLGTEVGRE